MFREIEKVCMNVCVRERELTGRSIHRQKDRCYEGGDRKTISRTDIHKYGSVQTANNELNNT